MTLKRLLGQFTLANQLTFLRLVAVPAFILAMLDARFGLAFGLFIGAAVTDLLDGLAARVLRQGTPLGAYLDPLADKLLLTSAFLMLTEFPSMLRQLPLVARLPVWLTILTISRDAFIVLVAFLLYLASNVTRFKPSVWGKLTTVAEMVTIGLFLLCNWLGRRHEVLDLLVWATLLLTLISGVHYLLRTIRMIGSTSMPVGPDES
ncbi:MAG TPA: CDP-alcohol phosphatidyltransferase family protein [Candidatus Polarisedimenticolaceae bacterium]|nr:CDP-alcohol phosphatidyltransferase family protein [Candidatus Polarisedimenticolaceae bacterium]